MHSLHSNLSSCSALSPCLVSPKPVWVRVQLAPARASAARPPPSPRCPLLTSADGPVSPHQSCRPSVLAAPSLGLWRSPGWPRLELAVSSVGRGCSRWAQRAARPPPASGYNTAASYCLTHLAWTWEHRVQHCHDALCLYVMLWCVVIHRGVLRKSFVRMLSTKLPTIQLSEYVHFN